MSESNFKRNKDKKKYRPKKRKNKLTIVFDENARREFLTGFHKRKVQRQNRAKEEFEKQLKAERKRIKAEAKEQYKKLLLSQKTIPELDDILSENIDMGTHSVTVTELSAADLAKKNNWIGINEVQFYDKKDEDDDDDDEVNKSHSEPLSEGKVEGMDVKIKKEKNYKEGKFSASTCKDIKKKIKQQATINVKNSSVFKKKIKLEKIKNIKLKKKQEKKMEKLQKKKKHKKK